jgi:hypothetical protein
VVGAPAERLGTIERFSNTLTDSFAPLHGGKSYHQSTPNVVWLLMLAFTLTHRPNKVISEPENPLILATVLAITLIYRR